MGGQILSAARRSFYQTHGYCGIPSLEAGHPFFLFSISPKDGLLVIAFQTNQETRRERLALSVGHLSRGNSKA